MEWLKKHTGTLIIFFSLMLSFWIQYEKIDKIDKELYDIKTILLLRNIMPFELAEGSSNANN